MWLVGLWPVPGIKVRTPVVELFVPDHDSLEVLARLAAKGIYDPQNQYLPRTPVGGWEDVASPEAERRFLRYFWAALADWRPERWNLMLAAKAGGDVVGVQEIGAQHFAATRTVSTGSWIGARYQGAGYGKAMREAVLHLAFDGLGAERADTAAWVTNHASLTVSRALGYRDNGTTTRAAEDRRVEQVNLTLRRSEWRCSAGAYAIPGITSDARQRRHADVPDSRAKLGPSPPPSCAPPMKPAPRSSTAHQSRPACPRLSRPPVRHRQQA